MSKRAHGGEKKSGFSPFRGTRNESCFSEVKSISVTFSLGGGTDKINVLRDLINFSQVIMETESRETQSVRFAESSSLAGASLIFARMLHDVSCPMDEGGLEDDEREGRRKEGHDRGGRP